MQHLHKKILLLICVPFLSLVCFAQRLAAGDTLRLLTIGNSFSEDGVERYLGELAREAGVTLIIGNAYHGGQSLEQHYIQGTEQQQSLELRIVTDGQRHITKPITLNQITGREPWDIVTLQQVSQDSGNQATYEPWLTRLLDWLKPQWTNPDVKLGFHMTWAYAEHSNHGGFAHYGSRQEAMYDSIRHAVAAALTAHKEEFSLVVPSGTAIQNMRMTYLGDEMTRDGYHLDLLMGRYTAACTWLEAITGINPVGLKYRPAQMDSVAAYTCQWAAHLAVQNPWSVSLMEGVGFPYVNDISPKALVKLNFTEDDTPVPEWNNILPGQRTYTWITDADQNPTGILLTLESPFCGTNRNGASYTTSRMLMPSSVSTTCMWGYKTGSFPGISSRDHAVIRLSHLNPRKKYDLTFFCSSDQREDLRETVFVTYGDKVTGGQLEASANMSETLTLKGVRPAEDASITIHVMPGPRNNNPYKFYYLNAMTIRVR